jgi:hypothetical protein
VWSAHGGQAGVDVAGGGLHDDEGGWRDRVAARLRGGGLRRRVLVAEAAIELCRAGVELALRTDGGTVRLLGTATPARVGAANGVDGTSSEPVGDDAPDVRPPDDTDAHRAVAVGRAVRRAAQRLPWRPTCLPQALAARRMLGRRDVAAAVHLGVRDAGVDAAHAWVTAGGRVVVGAAQHRRFTPVATFPGDGDR